MYSGDACTGGHRRRHGGGWPSVQEILDDLPYVEADDLAESLRYAAEAVRERELPLTRPA